MKRIATALITASLLGLSACWPFSDDASPSASGEAPGGTSPTFDASGDYCDLALQGAEIQGEVASNVQDLQDSLSDPEVLTDPAKYAIIQEWGQTLTDNAAIQSTLYRAMRDQVSDAAVVSAFDDIIAFNDGFAAPLGQAAAESSNFLEYATALSDVMSDPATQELANSAPAAAEAIATYTLDRCGEFETP